MCIEGDHVYLEPLAKDHIANYLDIFSPTIQQILRVPTIHSEKEYLLQKIEGHHFFYVIKEHDAKRIIGAIEIRDPGHRSQLYCWLNEQWWGAGYFQEAMRLAADHYFQTTHEDAISACVDCTNLRSYHALKKAGFVSQGKINGPSEKQFVMVLEKG